HVCEHCGGTGRVRSVESSALAALRTLEIEALKGSGEATLKAPRAVGLYILNEKRAHLARRQQTLRLFVTVVVDDDMAHAECLIERTSMEQRPDHVAIAPPTAAYEPMVDDGYDDEAFEDEEEDEEALEREDTDDDEPPVVARAREDRPHRDEEAHEEGEGARRGRRRRRRGRRDGEPREAGAAAPAPRPSEAPRDGEEDGGQGRRRRRGRRGGRRMREDGRPTDAFAWTRPWVPYGDDPFVWYDPSEDMKRDA